MKCRMQQTTRQQQCEEGAKRPVFMTVNTQTNWSSQSGLEASARMVQWCNRYHAAKREIFRKRLIFVIWASLQKFVFSKGFFIHILIGRSPDLRKLVFTNQEKLQLTKISRLRKCVVYSVRLMRFKWPFHLWDTALGSSTGWSIKKRFFFPLSPVQVRQNLKKSLCHTMARAKQACTHTASQLPMRQCEELVGWDYCRMVGVGKVPELPPLLSSLPKTQGVMLMKKNPLPVFQVQ